MPFWKSFEYDGLTVRVECPDQAHLTWLEEFVSPAFSPASDDTVDCTVTLEINDNRHAALLRGGAHPDGGRVRGFVLDRGPVDLESWASPGPEQVLFDADAEVFYLVAQDAAHIGILSESRYLSRRLALMRVVRELAMSAAWTRTSLVLHAAACELAGTGIIIAGPKGAGKTTLLMHALDAGARFIANDRVVVNVAGAHSVVRGMPTVITVGEQTRGRFPAFADRWAASGYNEWLAIREAAAHRPPQPAAASNLTPAQFCALLNAPLSNTAPAHAILFPRLADDVDGIRVQELSPASASDRLAASIFAARAPLISQVFALPGRSSLPDPAIVAELTGALISKVRSFDCILGRPTADITEAVRDLLSGNWT